MLEEYGNDPTIQSVEDLFPAISKLYRGDDEQAELCTRLRNLRLEAEKAAEKTLATRAAWAEAVALRRLDPAQAQSGLLEVAKRLNVQTDNPLIARIALMPSSPQEERMRRKTSIAIS